MENTPSKTCTKCGTAYPATTEFFRKAPRNRFGVSSWCKSCESYYHKERNKDPEVRRKKREWDRAHAKPRQPRVCASAEEVAASKKAWKHANREKVLAANRSYYQRKGRVTAQLYRKSNPEKIRAHSRNRHARKKQAEGTHTAADVQLKFQQQQGKCYWCSKKLDPVDYHADHIIALSKGGSNGPENLCCACPTCNLQKHNKAPWEFTGRLL